MAVCRSCRLNPGERTRCAAIEQRLRSSRRNRHDTLARAESNADSSYDRNGGDQPNCAEHGPRKFARGRVFFPEAGVARVRRSCGACRNDAARAGGPQEMDFGAGFSGSFRDHESDSRPVVHGDGDRARLLAGGVAGADSCRGAVHFAGHVDDSRAFLGVCTLRHSSSGAVDFVRNQSDGDCDHRGCAA